MNLESNDVALSPMTDEAKKLFPELDVSLCSGSLGGGPLYTDRRGVFVAGETVAWAKARETDVRWGGRSGVLGLLHVYRTRNVFERAKIAELIEKHEIYVDPLTECENAADILRLPPLNRKAERVALDRMKRKVASDRSTTAFPAGSPTRSTSSPSRDKPFETLRGANRILEALNLGRKEDGLNWRSFRREFETDSSCPVKWSGRGKKPSADKSALLTWYVGPSLRV